MTCEQMVRELVDRQQITDLIYAYCDLFDRNEPEGLAALFTDDARIDYGPEVPDLVGREAIVPAISAGLRDTFAATSHHVSNVRITFESQDAARSVSYVYAWHRYRDGSPDGELWGRYLHRFRRSMAGWRISELVLQAAGTARFHRRTMHSIGRRVP